MRKRIADCRFDAERSFYHALHTDFENVAFAGPADGESALKEARDVRLKECVFSLRYPLWHTVGFSMRDCRMDEKTRAAIWYAENGAIENCFLGGVKAVRECKNIRLSGCEINSPEFGWKSDGLVLERCKLTAEYPFFDSGALRLQNTELHGKYSFQYACDVTIDHCMLDTKDAFWHSKNVTVHDTVIKGEYLGWYSDGLTLVRCKIIGTQPLCYCTNLTLIDCETENADLAFEYSDVEAAIRGHIDSVKNPKSGRIVADSIGEIIREDAVMPCEAEIRIRK